MNNPKNSNQWDPRDLAEVPDNFNGYHWFSPIEVSIPSSMA